MNAKRVLLLGILAMIIVAAAFVGNWVWNSRTSGPAVSYPGEIRVYNGQNLGSINDFRLEAINGVQYTDVSSYRLVVTGLVKNETV